MSKFASLLDNVKWETGVNNGIPLQFVEHGDDACKIDGVPGGLIPFGSYSLMEELENGCDLHKLSSKVLNVEGDTCSRSRSPSSERTCGDLTVKGRELACNVPSISHVEEAASGRRYRNHYSTKLASSAGEYGSCLSSPMTSTNHSYYGDEDVDFDNQSNRGCRITYCWSRTPRYKGSNQSSHVEDYPLLPGNGNGESDAATPSHEVLSRSLSQKYRPKYFDELAGQEVVVKCLLSTILTGRITSVYLFHGPCGTGKTSTSKIFAAALNCLSQAAHSRPCGLCSECKSYFSGSGRDLMIDSGKLNRRSCLRSLIKSASRPPVSSRFKVFIINQSQLLCQETWGTLLNSLDNFSQHSVFILVTSELESYRVMCSRGLRNIISLKYAMRIYQISWQRFVLKKLLILIRGQLISLLLNLMVHFGMLR